MAQKNKILLLDFDEIQLNALKEWLINLGDIDAISQNSNDFTYNNHEAMPKFQLIIQSLGAQAKELKDEDINCPLLIIENKLNRAIYNHNEKIIGPFRFEQLEMKIRNILRVYELQQLESLNIYGHKYINSRRALINDKGVEIKLTDKEIEILSYLHKNHMRPVPREEMLREVWRYQNGVTTHTLETHIYRLRQKLAGFIGNKEALITDEGGYRLLN